MSGLTRPRLFLASRNEAMRQSNLIPDVALDRQLRCRVRRDGCPLRVRLFARVEFTFKQDSLHWSEGIDDPALQDFDKFASDTRYVHEMNADLRRQEACQSRAVPSDNVDVAA